MVKKERNKKEIESEKKKKETLSKLKKIGFVSGAVIALGLAAYAGWSAHEAYEVSQGEKVIYNNFEYNDYVGQTECSEHGFDYSIGNSPVSGLISSISFPVAFSNAFTMSNTLYPVPVPKL